MNEYLAKSPIALRIGAAVEHLVAASCILASDADLNVSTSLIDDEGVDLVFHRRGRPTTLAVQVKSRTTGSSNVRRGQFVADVRCSTFAPRKDLYMLFVVVDKPTATLSQTFFIPSTHFDDAAPTRSHMRRFQASLKAQANDKWRAYRMPFEELPIAILSALEALEAAPRAT